LLAVADSFCPIPCFICCVCNFYTASSAGVQPSAARVAAAHLLLYYTLPNICRCQVSHTMRSSIIHSFKHRCWDACRRCPWLTHVARQGCQSLTQALCWRWPATA
jgi:hypothetical protein